MLVELSVKELEDLIACLYFLRNDVPEDIVIDLPRHGPSLKQMLALEQKLLGELD